MKKSNIRNRITFTRSNSYGFATEYTISLYRPYDLTIMGAQRIIKKMYNGDKSITVYQVDSIPMDYHFKQNAC